MVLGRAERNSPCRIHFMRTWRNSIRAGARSRWAKAREGAIPSARTILSRRGWNSRHGGLKPRWTLLGPCRCDSGRRDQSCGRAWNSRPGGFKNRCALGRVGVSLDFARDLEPVETASRPGRTNFRRVVECIHASLRNSWAKALAGASPVPPTNLAPRPLASRRSVSQAGNAGANPVGATNFCRVVQIEPSVL